MVRNESEVIEIWVRYNLQVLDALIVIDHESVDNTFEILTALRNEGLSLYLFKWIDQQYSQAEAMIHHVRPFAERREAEFFYLLTATNFWSPRGKRSLKPWGVFRLDMLASHRGVPIFLKRATLNRSFSFDVSISKFRERGQCQGGCPC